MAQGQERRAAAEQQRGAATGHEAAQPVAAERQAPNERRTAQPAAGADAGGGPAELADETETELGSGEAGGSGAAGDMMSGGDEPADEAGRASEEALHAETGPVDARAEGSGAVASSKQPAKAERAGRKEKRISMMKASGGGYSSNYVLGVMRDSVRLSPPPLLPPTPSPLATNCLAQNLSYRPCPRACSAWRRRCCSSRSRSNSAQGAPLAPPASRWRRSCTRSCAPQPRRREA